MSVDDRIIDKLAKLLELADRGDEHEAQVAAQRAAELMAKYEIDAAEVAAHGAPTKPTLERGRFDAFDGADRSRVENWHKTLCAVVAESVGGRAWINGRGKRYEFLIIGPQGSVATARYMYMALERDVNRLSRAAARSEGTTQNAWRRAYAVGMVVRIAERLREGRRETFAAASTTAMVHVDATRRAVDTEFDAMQLRTVQSRGLKRPDAGSQGYLDGDDVDLGSADRARLAEGQRRLKS